MFRLAFVLVAALTFGANGAVLVNERLVNGSPINISAAPYTVSVLYNRAGSFTHLCGGVIVGRNTVLTSCRCTTGVSPAALRTRTSSSLHNNGGDVLQVQRHLNHQQYSATTQNNDISILYLNSNIPLGINAAIVILPAQAANINDNTQATFTGWGSTYPDGQLQTQLQRVFLPIVNHAECVRTYSQVSVSITANMICAGKVPAGPCSGDTGGPLVHNGILYGLSSFGRDCGNPNYPSVFTKVSLYRTWLNQNL